MAPTSTPPALPDIVAGLGSDSWRVRKDAAAAAAEWPRPDEVLPALVALLDVDAPVSARSAAVEALATMGATAVPALVALLERRAPERKFAIDALAAMRPRAARAAAPALVASLLSDEPENEKDENVRAAAAEALGGLGLRPGREAAAAVEALRRELGRGELLTRLCAAEALVALGARLPLAELMPLLDEATLRPAALELAGLAGDLEALPHLLHALASGPSRAARAAAARALVRLRAAPGAQARVEASLRASPPPVVNAIVAALEEGPLAQRRAALALAGWGRMAEALPALCAGLGDDEVHDVCAAAIGAFGPFAVAPLLELGRAAGPPLRREIMAVFPRLGAAAADARVAELCARSLVDEDAATAAAAARALGEIGGKDALGPLAHALARGGEVGAAAGSALARLAARWPEEVRLVAGGELSGPGGPGLCRVLGALANPADRPRILYALRGGEPSLRRAAAAALPSFGQGRDVVEALTFALADDDAGVRACAAAALGSLGARDAAAALTGACRDPDPGVAVAAVRALGRLGEPATAPSLRALAAGGAPVAFAALEALARLGDPADDALLVAALVRPDAEVVKAAARALGERHRPAPREALIALLAHPRWDVRRAAAQALAPQVGTAEVAAALRGRAGVEEDALVGEAIEAALGGG